MMKKLRHYLLSGLIMLLWSHTLHAQTLSPPGNSECSSALDFNGTDQYLDAPDGVYFDDNTFTIEAWVYPRSHGNYQRVIDFGNGDTNNNVLLAATEGTSGKPSFTVYNGSSNAGAYTANTAIPLNVWTHVAVVSTGTNVIIYLNGVADATYTGSPTVQAVTRTNNYIGRSNWSGDAHFDGMLDDIRVWNTARTQSEIQAAKDIVLSGSESGLLAYWDFDELTGTVANDKTANNRNATLMNMSNTNWYLINGRVTWYADLDGDGYASSVVSCTSPGAGYSDSLGELLEGDCDDTNAAINPGKTEVMGNGIDDDCNPATFDIVPFVTTWKTDNYGTSGSNQIIIPTTGSGYDYTVFWESTTDANVNGVVTGLTENATITFPEAGTYRVKIAGDFPRIYFNGGGDNRKIISIEQWGDIAWTSMDRAFSRCFNLTSTATDAPDLSGVTSMYYMFYYALKFNSDLSDWNVSNVTNMSYMFYNAEDFNGDLSTWNVSNVTDMSHMFRSAAAFNGDLSAWDVSNVTNMSYMFYNAQNFNSDLSNWAVSNVINMSYMFRGAATFNGDLSAWDVGNVTSMHYMFEYARAFDGDLGAWDISSVTNMSYMLDRCDMSAAHYDATLAGWATLGGTETKIPTGISLGAGGLSYCDAASHNTLATDYGWTITRDRDISVLSGEPVAVKLPPIISADAVQSLVAPQAVNHCTGETLTAVTDATLPITATTTITWTYADGNEATEDVTQQQYVYIGRPFVFTWEGRWFNLYVSSEYDYGYVIDWGDGVIDTVQTNPASHEYAATGPHTISVYGQFPGIKLGNTFGESGFRSIEQWGDIEWRTMRYMFANTNPVFNATDVPNLSQVNNMSNMFYNSGFNGDLSNWDVSSVTDMSYMFGNAQAFNSDLSAWDVSNVTNMSYMFYNASAFNGDLSNWNVSGVTNMNTMFYNATAFNDDLSGWDISSVTNMSSMLGQSGMSATHYDATLAGWATLGVNETKIPTAISLGANELFYCTPTGRESLTTNYGWTITGDADASVVSGLPQQKELPVIVSSEPVTSLEAPIAVNCAGDEIMAVTDVALPITASTTITWTYVDGNAATGDVTQQQYVYIGRPFVFTWEGDEAYLEGDSDYDYSYIIDWGDGTVDTLQSYDPEHAYATEGPHTISVSGQFPGIALGSEGGGLRSVEQWGDIAWRTMRYMFAYTNPEFNATDVPDLSQVTDMSRMFYYSRFNGDISAWDVSNVTNMESMFREAGAFNQSIGAWNVSNVTDMSWMFLSEGDNMAFNQDISGWDVSNVTKMHGMFRGAVKFNQDISNWDVSKVTNMRAMFAYATSFNQDLSAWDISSVTDMYNMLNSNGLSIANYEATLAGWATLGENETKIPASVNLGAEGLKYCNTANRNTLITDYSWTISGDKDISVTSGNPMVEKLPVIISEEPVTNLEAPVAINCAGEEITAVADVILPITANTTITWTYADGNEATEDVTQQQQVFVGRPFVTTWQTIADYGDQIIIQPVFDFIEQTNVVIDWGDGTTSHYNGGDPYNDLPFDYHEYADQGVYTISIYGDLHGITTDFTYGEEEDLAPYLLSIEQWGDVEWKTMEGAFEGTDSLQINATDAPDLTNVTSMSGMFSDATHFNADLSAWDVSNVTDMSEMFYNTSAFNGDLSNWNVSSVTDLSNMFSNSGISIRHYEATLKGWATLGENEAIPTGVTLGADGINYCDATGRDILVNDFGWTITDAGSYCPAPPVLAALEDKAANEGETLSFTVAATAGELPFEYKLDAASLAKGMTLDHTTGAFSWTPTHAQVGGHSVIVTLDDTQSPLVSETFTITVNAAPVLAAIGDQLVNEGEALIFSALVTDVDDTEFTFSLDDASLTKGMAITSSGAFSWTPVQEQVGEHSVTITVSDGALTDEETFTIIVNAVNDALVISSNAGLPLTQGGVAEITSELLSVTDGDNTTTELVYTVTALPANGTLKKGETVLAEHSTFTQADIDNHLISYTHDGFNEAADEFSFTVTDGSTTLTSTFAISINIVMAIEDGSIGTGAMSLYPVPAEDVVTLRITNAHRGDVSVHLFDANGREMLTIHIVKDREELVHSINITSIPSGVVLVKVKTGNHTQVLRMIKK